MQLEGYDGEALNDLKAGRTVRVDNVGLLVDEPAYAAIAAVGVQALLSVPLIVDGSLKVNLSVHQHEPRCWTDEDVALVQDVAERLWAEVVRARVEAALRESEARLRAFGDASQDALWMRDAETLSWTYLTPAFETIYGVSREQAIAGNSFRNWADIILPEDRALAIENIRRVCRGERLTFEYRIRRPSDGELRWLRDTDFPIFNKAGRVESIGGIGSDVTAEKETADRMQVLVAELQHRTRNLIAVVRSIAMQTMAETGPMEDFRTQFNDRLAALARVQGLLSQPSEVRITIGQLIRMELDALGASELEHRIEIKGPEVALRSSLVQTMALAIHELATNARKYGALANDRGTLRVIWSVETDRDGGRRLRLDWLEDSLDVAREVQSPAYRGYGRELIERALTYTLDARTSFELSGGSVRCTIDLPLDNPGAGRSPS